MINLYRIALTEAELEKGFFHSYRLPMPSAEYKDHSARLAQGQGGQAIQGYKSLTLQWSNLSPNELFTLESLVLVAIPSRLLYVTFNRANVGQDWIDVRGVPHHLEKQPVNGVLNSLVWQSVTLFLNNVVIVNDPSTVIN